MPAHVAPKVLQAKMEVLEGLLNTAAAAAAAAAPTVETQAPKEGAAKIQMKGGVGVPMRSKAQAREGV